MFRIVLKNGHVYASQREILTRSYIYLKIFHEHYSCLYYVNFTIIFKLYLTSLLMFNKKITYIETSFVIRELGQWGPSYSRLFFRRRVVWDTTAHVPQSLNRWRQWLRDDTPNAPRGQGSYVPRPSINYTWHCMDEALLFYIGRWRWFEKVCLAYIRLRINRKILCAWIRSVACFYCWYSEVTKPFQLLHSYIPYNSTEILKSNLFSHEIRESETL